MGIKTIHDEISDRTSWGIRGTGGFASKTIRLPSMPRPGRGCPGPGAYDSESAIRVLKNKDFNQAKHTAVFAGQLGKSASESSVPGPGHYNSIANSVAKEAAAAQSAFRSAAQRTTGITGTEDFPGPGEYFEDAKPSAEQANAQITNAIFKEPTQRRIIPVHRDLPAADAHARKLLGSYADEVGRECGGTLNQITKNPGPGYYEQYRDAIYESCFTGINGSNSFQPGTKRHEWTPQEISLRPGPGNYDPKMVVQQKITSAVSAFNSMTERNKAQFPPAPGPAYYSPQPPKPAKSFMLNAKRNWVQ